MRRVPIVDRIAAVASLGDGVRRRLYEYVASQAKPVGRDEAAKAANVQRPLAAYHLDRLAEQGLLDVRYERPKGRTGPGAGRPGKLYSRAATEVEVTLPPRHYDVAAELLATAVEEATPDEAVRALHKAARRLGRELGAEVGRHAARLKRADRHVRGLFDVLRDRGYEPYTEDDGTVRLRNCPFHRLAADHTDLVCGMNLAMMKGLRESHPDVDLEPALDPRAGECCVAFRVGHGRA